MRLKHDSSNFDLFPDPLDRNFYCRVCKSTRKTLWQYRAHCRQIHRMTLGPIVKPFPHPNAVIDIHDPDFYCAKCDKRFATKLTFSFHLERIHSLFVTNFANPDAVIDIQSSDFYCKKCDKYLSSRRSFQYHLLHTHNLTCVIGSQW